MHVYLNSKSGVTKLLHLVDLLKSQPVGIVDYCRPKPITIFYPVLRERHQTSDDLPVHQDPTVDSQ